MKEQIKDYLMQDLDGAGVYVGTYRKYNEGSLYGAWIDLEQFTDAEDFLEVCHTLHDDEEDPELMFQDFQGFPRELYGESMSTEEIQTILDYLALDEEEREMIADYIQCFGGRISDFEDLLDKAKNSEHGKWDDFQDFADMMADEMISSSNAPEFITNYFDYEKFARELGWDYEIGDNGWVFSNY